MNKPFKMIMLSTAAVIALSFAGQEMASAASFKDIANVPSKDIIIAMQNGGMVKGVGAQQFAPYKSVSQAEGVALIVKALGLNLDLVRFDHKPKATDYFKNVSNNAWYSNAFIIAAVNGLDLPKDLMPNKKLSREAFTYQLIQAIEVSGKLPMVKPVVVKFKDQDRVTKGYSAAIQRALNYGVVHLDAHGKFNPKKEISRADATVEISNALAYLKAHTAPVVDNKMITGQEAVQLIKKVVGPRANLQIKIDPNAIVTRESFTSLLVNALQTSGQLPRLNLIPADIKDNNSINVLNQGAIQTALALGFVKLDQAGNFNPTAGLTRADATEIANQAIAYLKAHHAPVDDNETITGEEAVQLIKQAVGPRANLQIKIDPNAIVTRESFTSLLINTLQTSGQLPRVKVNPAAINDNDSINVLNQGAIQTALVLGFVKLDQAGNFNPTAGITRADATEIVNQAVAYLKAHPAPVGDNETITGEEAVQLIKQAVGPRANLQIKIDPNAIVTRESFTSLLVNTLQTSGQLPRVKVNPAAINDNDSINVLNQGAIQTALVLGFVKLDQAGNFNPTAGITRADATEIVNQAVAYVKAHPAPAGENEMITAEQAVQFIKQAVGSNLQIKIDPNASVTRESFTYLLIHTLQKSGKLPMLNLIPAEIKDNDAINVLHQGAIQTALALKIVDLDAAGNFNPLAGVTRADAAAMVSRVHDVLNKFSNQ
ncbi:S-layer homology domain-containing protein [Paenibacillus sp. R14(2021)]|uniref:S-layer homology domain-containing protein n=1 Tax=Paenibacillus sp. R14(2021) TaxID=2859228 RepID=UPI001C61269D|nr:S-layer homology domain-containing protein [Paenibacillus sp. R14(2021)]